MYNFKRNSTLYIVENGNQHIIEIYPDLTFSQTLSEEAYRVRTLHELENLHEGAVITRARPVNFQFTYPLRDQASIPIAIALGTDFSDGTCITFDLYIEMDEIIYKIEKATIDSTVFNLSKFELVTVSFSGQGSRLSVHTGAIPGTPVPVSPTDYVIIEQLDVVLDSTTVTSVTGINIEIVNDVQWQENATLHETLAGNIIYPQNCYSESRRISGSVTQYLTADNENDFTAGYNTNGTLTLDVYGGSQLVTPILGFNLPSVVFTSRENLGELLTKTHDFRLTDNSSNASGNRPLYKGV